MAVYKPGKGEENHVHLRLQNREFDSRTGRSKFKPQLFICIPKDVRIFFEAPNGLSLIEVLHTPKDFKFPKKTVKNEDGKNVQVDYPVYAEYLAEFAPKKANK